MADHTASDVDPDVISPKIPAELHPAVMVAREQWRRTWPGMELDGTADLIVMALAHNGFLCTASPQLSEQQRRRADEH